MVKSPPAVQETWFDPWVGKISWRRAWQLTPIFWRIPRREEPGRLQSVGYKELDTNEQLTHTHTYMKANPLLRRKKNKTGNFLVVQWLGLHALMAENWGSIPW